MPIPQEIIEEIKERTNIVDLVSEYVNLKKSGKNYKGLCPFHSEKTPSFVVNEEKGIFHCFGCGAGGNIFTFIMKIQDVSFPEAVRILSKRAGIDIKKGFNNKYNKEKGLKESLYEINRVAVEYYKKNLYMSQGKNALEYLYKRGLNENIINTYNLGYAPDGWDNLIKFMKNKKIGETILEKVGLIVKNNKNTGYYDRFRDRIMFPIQDSFGRFIGFGGRTLKRDSDVPKYLNTNDNEIFHKGKNLYGFYIAKKDIKDSDSVFIVEGYMDVIKMYQNGVHNVVAPLGTALTEDQAYFILRYTKNIYLTFDGDDAGKKAAIRGIEIFHKIGVDPRIVLFPEGMDPADFFSKYSFEDFKYMIDSSLTGIEYITDYYIGNDKKFSAQEKLILLEKLYNFYSIINDEIIKNELLEKLSKKLNLSVEIIKREFSRFKKPGKNISNPDLENEKYSSSSTSHSTSKTKENRIKKEFQLLLLLINNPDYFYIAQSRLEEEYFIGKWTKYLWNLMIGLYKNQKLNVSTIMDHINDEKFLNYLSEKLFDDFLNINVKEQVVDLVSYIKEKYLKDRMKELTYKIHLAELGNDDDMLAKLISEKQILKGEIEKLKTLRDNKSLIT